MGEILGHQESVLICHLQKSIFPNLNLFLWRSRALISPVLSVIQKEFYLDQFTSLLQKNTGPEIREHTFQPWQSQTNFRTWKKSFTHYYFQKSKGQVRLCTFIVCESIPHFLSHKDMILNILYLIHRVTDFKYLLIRLILMNLDCQSPIKLFYSYFSFLPKHLLK